VGKIPTAIFINYKKNKGEVVQADVHRITKEKEKRRKKKKIEKNRKKEKEKGKDKT
jgi:hypothetical protein